MTSKQYYDQHIKFPGEDICSCGKTKQWSSWGYNKWCSSICPNLKEIRTNSVRLRFQGSDGAEKKQRFVDSRGKIDPNIEKRRDTIQKKCEALNISVDEYYSQHSKKCFQSMTEEQKNNRTMKRMQTVLSTNKSGGRSYYKPYMLFGKSVIVQGYEPRILDYLQTVTEENQLIVANGKKLKSIKYNSIKGVRLYFPDMILKNLIVEVKSDYTFHQHRNNVFEKIGGVFDINQSILLVIPSRTEVRKNRLEGTKKLLDWAISSQASNDCFVAVYDEGSTTILIGVESNDSKCRGSSRILEERDIVWSSVKTEAAI
jgi:hypothetical protein